MSPALRIATRESQLALWQANYVKSELERIHRDIQVSLIGIRSRGDQLSDVPLAKVGGKGLFVKELETALLEERADIAVHSVKDVPAGLPQGLELGVICARADPSDALVSNRYSQLDDLPAGALVGTSSLRRECQLRRLRPDLAIRFLRGNIDTRLRKLDAGEYDAIILASAGLLRLGMARRIRQRLPFSLALPAVGQGALGIELRGDDSRAGALIRPLHHPVTANCVRAERAFSARLQGSCQTPIAGLAEYAADSEDQLWLRGLVGRPDGSELLRAEATASAQQPEQLGCRVAEDLLERGAGALLAALHE